MWRHPQFPTDLVTFTEEILNGKHHFCAGATGHLEMFYLGLCRYFKIIVDVVETINSTHYYRRSFRDEMLHLDHVTFRSI